MSMNDPNLLATFLGRRNQWPRPEIASEACDLTRNECRLLILDLARIVETTAAKGTWPAAGDLGKIRKCLQDAKDGLK